LAGEIADFFYFAVMHGKLKPYLRAKIDVLRSLKKTLLKRNAIMQNKKVDSSYILALMTPVWQKDFIIAKMKKIIKG
jgi:hypothetical protein